MAAVIHTEAEIGRAPENEQVSEPPQRPDQLTPIEQTAPVQRVGSQKVYRHKLPVRLWHWLNAVCVFILIMSGLQIFNAHPALYWGDRSDRDQALLSIRPMKTETGETAGITTILGHQINTTGVLGYSNGSNRAFPAWATIPGPKWLAMGRQWHLFFAWLFVTNGLIFATYALVGRHVTRDLVPTSKDLRGIGKAIADHAAPASIR